MNIKVVIGANYGDEGKGRMTNYLADSTSLVVLNNGGPQRGHTVKLNDGTQHVFHHFGSGTLKGAATFITEDFYVNPILFMREYRELKEKLPPEVPVFPKVYMDFDCTITTPYEMIANQIISTYMGAKNTCGLGIFETSVQKGKICIKDFVENECCPHYRLTESCRNYFKEILKLKYEQLHIFISEMMRARDVSCDMSTIKKLVKDYFAGINVENLNNNFLDDFAEMIKKVRLVDCTDNEINDLWILTTYGTVIIENGQGLLLDGQLDPIYGTPSKTGADGTRKFISKINNKFVVESTELIYVTRPYLTRHGDGPMLGDKITNTNDLREILRVESTNVPNEWQGTMRFSSLNWAELLKRVNNDSSCLLYPHKTSIAINKLGSKFKLTKLNDNDWTDFIMKHEYQFD